MKKEPRTKNQESRVKNQESEILPLLPSFEQLKKEKTFDPFVVEKELEG